MLLMILLLRLVQATQHYTVDDNLAGQRAMFSNLQNYTNWLHYNVTCHIANILSSTRVQQDTTN